MMASLNGFSHSFSHPLLSTRYRLSAKGEHFPVPSIFCAAKTRKWSISEDHILAMTSKVHHYQNLNVQTPSYLVQGKFSMGYEGKVEDVRQLLQSTAEEKDPIESLVFVDAIQRLGVSSYFQDEIQTILQQQYKSTKDHVHGFYSLHDVSLLFRLLRQHGYHISSDVFNNFKGKDGRFQGKLRQDIRGLMELYEAAQLSVEGEYILDEAANFSSHLLQEFVAADVGKSWSKMVITNKLRHPYHKTIARLTEKYFLQDFGGRHNSEWRKSLRQLSVMDLHKRQPVYQEELIQISKWWNELGLGENLKLARNQPLKWYTWSMAILIDDISLSFQRVEITKPITFIYLIDDIFDLYGTLDELNIFTEAVNKWDYAAIDTLPNYMKMCYRALLDTTNEIARKIYDMHGFNPIDSLKATWANLCNAFLVEAKWFVSGELPTADVYLENGKVSSGVHVVLDHLFFLLGLGGVNRGQINLKDTSQITSNVAAILRLWDDLGSAKDEHQDGKDGSFIECYRKEHIGASIGEAREHAIDMIANEWKSLNKECLRLNQNSAACFKIASLNLARMVPLMYSYDDNQELPLLEEYIKFMLLNETTQGAPQINQERFV